MPARIFASHGLLKPVGLDFTGIMVKVPASFRMACTLSTLKGMITIMENNATSTRKRIYAKEEVCIGCRLCEVHCVAAHSQYKNDIVKAFKKSPQRPLARITVEEDRPVSFGLQCRHCDDPKCVKSCITGAMQQDPATGIVTVDESRCIGCWTCILACPYGVVKRDFKGRKVASKCDFCIELGANPACVKNCPNDALYVGEVNYSCDGGNNSEGGKIK